MSLVGKNGKYIVSTINFLKKKKNKRVDIIEKSLF